MTLHELLDTHYGENGGQALRRMLGGGASVHHRDGELAETPLHVAARRRRLDAVGILLDHGAEIDATNRAGKTAYAHAVRRTFTEVAELLRKRGANTFLSEADHFALAVTERRFEDAGAILDTDPRVARTGNSEEDRLLSDIAGRNDARAVRFLIDAGAPLDVPGLDDGTPLHVAAWFGQPENTRLLLEAGAPLEVWDSVHESSPLGWAVHGSRYSGGADVRQDAYVEVTEQLLRAGASLHHPDTPESDAFIRRLLDDASPRVREVLERHIART